jgi:hypothetical protein
MQLRCKDGDLAVVIHDEVSCVDNVGKLVRVAGPLCLNRHLGLSCWLIEPVRAQAWRVADRFGDAKSVKNVTFGRRIEHPDAWLMPIRPERSEADVKDVAAALVD